jgi:predicted MPP superfamily phosphohydrolase
VDKRIIFLKNLKKQLHQFMVSDNNVNAGLDQTKQSPITNYSRLRAQMLAENVQSGIAFDEISFNNSGVFTEFTNGVELNFHIYPLMSEVAKSMPEDLDVHKKTEEKNLLNLAVTKNI